MKRLIILIFCVFIFSGCNSVTTDKNSDEEEQREQVRIDSLVKDIATKYNASLKLDELTKMLDEGKLESPYSYEVQEKIESVNSSPMVFRGSLTDIIKKNGLYIAYFESDYYLSDYKLMFKLQCSENKLKQLVSNRPDKYSTLAVVSKDNKAYKTEFRVRATGAVEDGAEVLIDNTNIIIIEGTYLDSINLDNDNK